MKDLKILLTAFGNRTYPVGLAEIYYFLKRKGYDPNFIHLFDNVNKLDNVSYIPDYVCITCITIERHNLDKVVNKVKAKWPSAKIVLGGRHFSTDVFEIEQNLYDKIDYVVYGDGEYALLDIFNDKINDKIIQGKLLTQEDYDDTDFISAGFLRTHMNNRNPHPVLFSRGCPFQCAFCCDRRIPLLRKDPEKAAWYVKYLKDEFNLTYTTINDDVLTVNKKWLRQFLYYLEKYNVKMRFEVFIHGRMFDKDLLDLLMAIGVHRMSLGGESGDNDILKLINKKTTTDDYRKIHALTLPYADKIDLHGLWMIGNMGETAKTLEKTVKLSKEVGTDAPWFSYAIPFPGTVFWEKAEEYGRVLTYDFSKWWNERIIFIPNDLTAEEMTYWYNEGMRWRK
jgi:radical SAM superfamily enzyme YgiQ (UPF0313 family)